MKVKEAIQKRKDKEFERDLSFEERLDYFSKKPSNEKQSHKTTVQNNPNYYPIQGA